MVETVFLVLKRKYGESLKARKFRLQVKEVKIKVILYNLSRLISSFALLVLIEEFYRALAGIYDKQYFFKEEGLIIRNRISLVECVYVPY
jgi:hypothetical protein